MFNDEVAKLISRSGGVGVADAVLQGNVEGAGGGVMEPLEQVTVLMTLMKRLGQVMDHERAVLRSMRIEALPDIQDEKEALAEAYEIELSRLRCSPEIAGVARARACAASCTTRCAPSRRP